jgi:hypothetical protein
VDPEIRPQFEVREPGVRQYVREVLPPAFWLEEDKKAWGELLLLATPGPDPSSGSAAGTGNDERSRLYRVNVQRTMMLATNMNIEALDNFLQQQSQTHSQIQPNLQGPPQQQGMEEGVEMQQIETEEQQLQQSPQQKMEPLPLLMQSAQQCIAQSKQPQPIHAAPLQTQYADGS